MAGHAVKIDGKWYAAGEDIPSAGGSSSSSSSDAAAAGAAAVSDVLKEGKVTIYPTKMDYTHDDINNMTVSALRKVATQLEIADAKNKTAKTLKAEILAKLGI